MSGAKLSNYQGPYTEKQIRNFYRKVKKTEYCWEWTGSVNKQGYARFKFRSNVVAAHVWIYVVQNGLYQQGLELDHLCFNQACVNVNHLEPVPVEVNRKRQAEHRRRKECPSGHEYTPENSKINSQGYRICRICWRKQHARRQRRRRKEIRDDLQN